MVNMIKARTEEGKDLLLIENEVKNGIHRLEKFEAVKNGW